MIHSGYSFNFIHTKAIKEKYHLREHKYAFKTRLNKRYIVNVEEYQHKLFVIKFYLKSHEHSKNKYNLLANNGDAFRILSTCVNIILHTLAKTPTASFGFIGEHSIGEEKNNTQRFRIYKRVTENYFPADKFEHALNVENSSYLILNKKNKTENLKEKAQVMFNQIYLGLE
jgi:hypothetical protein